MVHRWKNHAEEWYIGGSIKQNGISIGGSIKRENGTRYISGSIMQENGMQVEVSCERMLYRWKYHSGVSENVSRMLNKHSFLQDTPCLKYYLRGVRRNVTMS